MIKKVFDNIYIDCNIDDISDEELAAYVQRGREKYGYNLLGIVAKIDGDFVDIEYRIRKVKFTRLRRITGYLVGDMAKWNDAKRQEEGDRVKHGYDE